MDPHSTEASKRNETTREEHPYIPVVSFDLLNKYSCQLKRSRTGISNAPSPQTTTPASSRLVLSAETISAVSNTTLQEKSRKSDNNDYGDIELGLNLTLAAEKISNQEFDAAEELLRSCRHVSASAAAATPIQKVVHYFAEALRERIDVNKGQIDLEREAMQVFEYPNSQEPDKVAYEVELPCSQITGFVATQAIMESVGSASRIHIIDFTVGSGSHWPILMHAIASRENCPLELLKITAVGAFQEMLEETGRWLSSFAESLNLPFSFKLVLSELGSFKTDLLQLEDDEMVAVNLNVRLWSLLVWPDRLEAFIGEIKKLNPCLMVAAEVEVSTNTPLFLPRFYEALFYCSAIFDCYETVLQPDSQFRKVTEQVYFRNGIRDVVVHDGEERIHRQERLDFWREMFSRFGLVEVELSNKCMYQASLVLKWCSSWSSCTMNMDGKSVIIHWKGTPIKSISAWKFPRD